MTQLEHLAYLLITIPSSKNIRPTKALAEAYANGVEGCTEVFDVRAGLNSYMPDSCPVEVHFDTVFVCKFGDGNDLFLGNDGPVERIF